MDAITYERIDGTIHTDDIIYDEELKNRITKDYPVIAEKINNNINNLHNVKNYEELFIIEFENFCNYKQIPLPYQKVVQDGLHKGVLYRDAALVTYIDVDRIITEYKEYRESGEPCGDRLYLNYKDDLLSIGHVEYDGCGPFEVLDYELLCTPYEFARLMVTYLNYKKQYDELGVFISFSMM